MMSQPRRQRTASDLCRGWFICRPMSNGTDNSEDKVCCRAVWGADNRRGAFVQHGSKRGSFTKLASMTCLATLHLVPSPSLLFFLPSNRWKASSQVPTTQQRGRGSSWARRTQLTSFQVVLHYWVASSTRLLKFPPPWRRT